MQKNLNQRFGASHGPGDYVLYPGEVSAEGKVGSSGRARQGARVSGGTREKDRLTNLGRALQNFGLGLLCDWYKATRFTPAASFLPQ
jgi:hypothetical protein